MMHPILLSFLAFCLIPNLPYYLWLDRFALTRAIVNVDYLILGIIAIFVSVVMTIMFIVDAFVFIRSCIISPLREFVMSMSYARYSLIQGSRSTFDRYGDDGACDCGRHRHHTPLICICYRDKHIWKAKSRWWTVRKSGLQG